MGGDSAGGNLAAAICLKARDEARLRISGQVLIYPSLGGDLTSASYISHTNASGPTTRDVMYYCDTCKGLGHRYAERCIKPTSVASRGPSWRRRAPIPCPMIAKITRVVFAR